MDLTLALNGLCIIGYKMVKSDLETYCVNANQHGWIQMVLNSFENAYLLIKLSTWSKIRKIRKNKVLFFVFLQ